MKSWLSIVSVRLSPPVPVMLPLPLAVLAGVSWTMKPFALELPRDAPVVDAMSEGGRSERGCFYMVRWSRHCTWMERDVHMRMTSRQRVNNLRKTGPPRPQASTSAIHEPLRLGKLDNHFTIRELGWRAARQQARHVSAESRQPVVTITKAWSSALPRRGGEDLRYETRFLHATNIPIRPSFPSIKHHAQL